MNCVICGKPGCQSRAKVGWLCRDCIKACGGHIKWMTIRNMPVEEIRIAVEAYSRDGDAVFETRSIFTAEEKKAMREQIARALSGDRRLDKYILIDSQNRTVRFPQVSIKTLGTKAVSKQSYPYTDILGWELIENGSTVTKGGLGAAAVGGALFGGAGAVAGGIVGRKKTDSVCKDLRLKVTLRSLERPAAFIDFVLSPVKTTSTQYAKAQETAHKVMSLLQVVYEEGQRGKGSSSEGASSSADEIRKYKGLLDDGIITEEEFEAKKKQLMGI